MGRFQRIYLIVFLVVTFVYIFYRGDIVMMLNPKYGKKNLIGLTSSQVIQRLGAPDYDSGDERENDQHMHRAIAYEYAGTGRTIYLTDDKVDGAIWDRK